MNFCKIETDKENFCKEFYILKDLKIKSMKKLTEQGCYGFRIKKNNSYYKKTGRFSAGFFIY